MDVWIDWKSQRLTCDNQRLISKFKILFTIQVFFLSIWIFFPSHFCRQFSSCYVNNTRGVYLLRGVYPSYKSLSLFKAAKLTVPLMWDFNLTDVWGWEHSGDRDHSFIHTLMAPICVWIISYHYSSVPLSVGAATLAFHSLQRENQKLVFSVRNSP